MDWDNPIIIGEVPASNISVDAEINTLRDPFVVQMAMLTGSIAKPTLVQIMHIYADEFAELLAVGRENGIEDSQVLRWAAKSLTKTES
jgi:hypothetical protein